MATHIKRQLDRHPLGSIEKAQAAEQGVADLEHWIERRGEDAPEYEQARTMLKSFRTFREVSRKEAGL